MFNTATTLAETVESETAPECFLKYKIWCLGLHLSSSHIYSSVASDRRRFRGLLY